MDDTKLEKLEVLVDQLENLKEHMDERWQNAFNNLNESFQTAAKETKKLKAQLADFDLVGQRIEEKLKETIQTELNQAIEKTATQLAHSVDRNLQDQIGNQVQSLSQKVSEANATLDRSKQSFTRRRLFMSGTFCLSAILTALAINWAFPRTVNRYFSDEMAKICDFGIHMKEVWPDLPKETRYRVQKALKEQGTKE